MLTIFLNHISSQNLQQSLKKVLEFNLKKPTTVWDDKNIFWFCLLALKTILKMLELGAPSLTSNVPYVSDDPPIYNHGGECNNY